ncbi:hypothetical protein PRJ_2466 [Pseudomonas sp. XWY-1]|nr:hypothetical protein PRJ_2466 [Pseudomonas sp. XWY-1]
MGLLHGFYCCFFVACAGLFAGEPAPTGHVIPGVGAGLPAKRPVQEKDQSLINTDFSSV